MAAYYKKRRGPSGPNKNEQKVARHQELERQVRSMGSLGERFPSVERLSVQFEIRSPQQLVLSQEKREFRPSDACNFSAPCPGRCGVGSFDLAAKIEQVVVAKETSSASSGTCKKPLYAGAAEVCGCEIRCRIETVYAPEPVPEPAQAPPAEII